MSYRDLEVWQLARSLSIAIHRLTLERLPKYEMYEEGTQIRRSSKSVRSNIVEGYGRRMYKLEYLRFLTYAQASCDETTDHLEALHETGSLDDKALFHDLHQQSILLGKKLNSFRTAVNVGHRTVRESETPYGASEGEPLDDQ